MNDEKKLDILDKIDRDLKKCKEKLKSTWYYRLIFLLIYPLIWIMTYSFTSICLIIAFPILVISMFVVLFMEWINWVTTGNREHPD